MIRVIVGHADYLVGLVRPWFICQQGISKKKIRTVGRTFLFASMVTVYHVQVVFCAVGGNLLCSKWRYVKACIRDTNNALLKQDNTAFIH